MELKQCIETFIGYLRVEKKYSEHTVISYTNDLNGFNDYCRKTYDVTNVADVKHLHIRSWIVSMMSEDMSPVSVNRKISALRSLYKWLIRRGIVENNPMLKIIAPKKPKRLPVVLQEINMQKLTEQPILMADDDVNVYNLVRDTFIIVLLYSTGIRRAELVGLQVSDFDLYRKEVRIVGKGNKVRSIPLTETLISAVNSYLKARKTVNVFDSQALFLTEKGKPIYARLVHDIVQRQLSMITTLSKKSPHVLRHTFATHMLDNGADLNGIKEILGHASLAATQIYTQSSIQKLKDVYRKAHPSAQEKI